MNSFNADIDTTPNHFVKTYLDGSGNFYWQKFTSRSDPKDVSVSLLDLTKKWEWSGVLGEWTTARHVEDGGYTNFPWCYRLPSEHPKEVHKEPVAGTPDQLKILELEKRLKDTENLFDRLLEISDRILTIAEKGPLFIKLP